MPQTKIRKLILRTEQSPGDMVMLTAAMRDLHLCYPGVFQPDVRTPYPQLWENNPFLTALRESDPGVEVIRCHYPLIHQSNRAPFHFIHGFIQFLSERLGLNIRPTAFKGDIHLSKEEMEGPPPLEELAGHLTPALSPPSGEGVNLPVWLMAAGGKRDFTIKWWEGARNQQVVDHFRGRIQFVQVGAAKDHHFNLTGVIDLRGKTDLRQLIRLVYHCDGAVCPVTLLMHLVAAVPVNKLKVESGRLRGAVGSALRPCVVIAGGREPAHWEEYPGHQFIHTIGMLPCCASGGCWRSRTLPLGDGDEKDRPENLCVDVVGNLPRCMDMITAEEVIRRIEMYLAGRSSRREEAHFQRQSNERLLSPSLSSAPSGGEGARRAGEEVSINHEPLSIENAAARAEEFIKTIPDYPGAFAGRGIVICGGGMKYFPCAWVCIQMLRRVGCTLPIQLWHLGPEEMDEEMKELVKPVGVECVDGLQIESSLVEATPRRSPVEAAPSPPVDHHAATGASRSLWGDGASPPRLGGWELKPFAILHCPFKEVLYLDADNVPVVNPEFLFDTAQFAMTGAIFWPDYQRLGPWRSIWKICGVPYQDEPEFESGQVVVDKERCWRALCLTHWYNRHSDFFYQHIHGDKDTFHMAFLRLGQPYAMPSRPIESLENVVMCQHDFEGRRIFQHRNLAKWILMKRNRRVGGFLFEEECIAYLEELRRKWSATRASQPRAVSVVGLNGAVHAGRVSISAVMISCPDRAAVRQKTLQALAATDWGGHQVHVEVDRGRLERRQDRQTETSRLALLRSLEMPGGYVLFLEDDLEFNTHLVENLSRWEPLQSGLITLAGLYNPNVGQPENSDSWFIAEPEKIYGSQGFLLSKETVRFSLEHWAEVEGMQDMKISRLAARMGRAIFYHAPSLVQHVGEQSVWGGRFHQAADFDACWRNGAVSALK